MKGHFHSIGHHISLFLGEITHFFPRRIRQILLMLTRTIMPSMTHWKMLEDLLLYVIQLQTMF